MERYSNSREDVIIEVTDNKLCATMTIKRDGGVIDQDEIISLINQAGISNGFISSIDQEGEKELNHAFKIAEVEAIDQDVTLELYYKSDELYYPKSLLNEANIFRLVYVQKGSAIGKLSYDEDMLSRKDVYGNYLLTSEGRDNVVAKYKGENIDFDYNSKEYIAKISGYLSLGADGKYSVINHLFIKHDIDRSYGNIYILGNLTIQGDIMNVRHIRVIGELTVEGNVIQSNIYAEQGIIIKGKLENCNSGGVTSPKRIICSEIITSKVFSGDDLIVKGNVYNSRLVGETSIQVDDSAEVIASDLQSSRYIKVGNVKSEGESISDLEISVSPYTKEQLMLLTRELVYFNENDSENDKVPIIRKEIKQLEETLSNKVEEAIELENSKSLMIETTGQIAQGTRLKIMKESTVIDDDSFKHKKIITL